MDAISAYKLEELKSQLEQELHTLVVEKLSHEPYIQAYLRDFVYEKVRKFEQENYLNMSDCKFDIDIDEDRLYNNGTVDINLRIKPNVVQTNINTNFTINNTIQNRNDKREVMKKKIQKVRNA